MLQSSIEPVGEPTWKEKAARGVVKKSLFVVYLNEYARVTILVS